MKLRYTEKSDINLKAKASKQLEKIHELDEFLSGFNRKWWDAVTQRLNLRMEALRDQRELGLDQMGEAELKANIAAEREIRGVIDLPKRAAEARQNLKLENEKIKGIINVNRDKVSRD